MFFGASLIEINNQRFDRSMGDVVLIFALTRTNKDYYLLKALGLKLRVNNVAGKRVIFTT